MMKALEAEFGSRPPIVLKQLQKNSLSPSHNKPIGEQTTTVAQRAVALAPSPYSVGIPGGAFKPAYGQSPPYAMPPAPMQRLPQPMVPGPRAPRQVAAQPVDPLQRQPSRVMSIKTEMDKVKKLCK